MLVTAIWLHILNKEYYQQTKHVFLKSLQSLPVTQTIRDKLSHSVFLIKGQSGMYQLPEETLRITQLLRQTANYLLAGKCHWFPTDILKDSWQVPSPEDLVPGQLHFCRNRYVLVRGKQGKDLMLFYQRRTNLV